METKVKAQQYIAPSSPDQETMQESAETELPMLPPATETYNQWQQVGAKVSAFLEQLPQSLGRYFNEYKLPIVSVALTIAAIVTLRVVLAIVDALNDIPLLAPTFKLIGVGYVTCFTFRYLLKTETRQELAAQIQVLKEQLVGGKAS